MASLGFLMVSGAQSSFAATSSWSRGENKNDGSHAGGNSSANKAAQQAAAKGKAAAAAVTAAIAKSIPAPPAGPAKIVAGVERAPLVSARNAGGSPSRAPASRAVAGGR